LSLLETASVDLGLIRQQSSIVIAAFILLAVKKIDWLVLLLSNIVKYDVASSAKKKRQATSE
jgi:hypothetical protein